MYFKNVIQGQVLVKKVVRVGYGGGGGQQLCLYYDLF